MPIDNLDDLMFRDTLPEWGEVQGAYTRQFPNEDQEQLRQRYERARSMHAARSRHRQWNPNPHEQDLEAIPFVSTISSAIRSIRTGGAQQRLRAGTATDTDYDALAQSERRQFLQSNQSLDEQIAGAARGGVAMLGEAALGGAALRGAAGLGGGIGRSLTWLGLGSQPAAATSALGRLGSAVARTGLQTATMPSMYLDQAIQNNTEAQRDPLDLRGFGSSFTVGMMNVALLGSIGKQANKLVPGEGVGSMFSRIGLAGPVGVLETQLVDVIASAAQLKTGYGTVGSILRGEADDALKHALVTSLTFSAFAGWHEGQRGGEVRAEARPDAPHGETHTRYIEQFAAESRAMAAQGITREAAGEALGRQAGRAAQDYSPMPRPAPAQGGMMGMTQSAEADVMREAGAPTFNRAAQMEMERRNAQGGMARSPVEPTPVPPEQGGMVRPPRPDPMQGFMEDVGRILEPTERPSPERPARVDAPMTPEQAEVTLAREQARIDVEGRNARPGTTQPQAEPVPAAEQRTLAERFHASEEAIARAQQENPGINRQEAREISGAEAIELTEVFKEAKLGKEDIRVLVERAIEGRTLESIGEDFGGIGREAVRLREKEALAKLGKAGQSVRRMIHDHNEADAQTEAIARGQTTDKLPTNKTEVKAKSVDRSLSAKEREYKELNDLWHKQATGVKLSKKDQRRFDVLMEKYHVEEGKGGTGRNQAADAAASPVPGATEAGPGPGVGEAQGESPVAGMGAMQASAAQAAPNPLPANVQGAAAPVVPEPPPHAPKESVHSWMSWLKSFANQTFPYITKLSQPAGEHLARAANAPTTAKATWDYLSSILKIGNTSLADLEKSGDIETRRGIGAVWQEMSMRYAREQLGKEASRLHQEAQNPNISPAEKRRLIAESAEMTNREMNVRTLVGQQGSPLATEADFVEGQKQLKFFFEAIKQEWGPIVDANYRGVKGLDPQDAIDVLTQIPGMAISRIHLPADQITPGAVISGTAWTVGGKQSMNNLGLRNPVKQATLASEAYDVDVVHMMQKALNTYLPASRRAAFVRKAIDAGIIEAVMPGDKPTEGYQFIGLDPRQGLPDLPADARYYAKPEAYKEIIQGLGIGERPGSIAEGLRPVMDKMYNIALMSPVELLTHAANHVTALFRPGMGIPLLNLKDSFRNMYSLWRGDPAILDRVRELTDMSASFSHSHDAKTGILGERFAKYDPTAYINKFTSGLIDIMQKGVRVQLADAFDTMAKDGYFPTTETAKRDFINSALGNYNNRANNAITQFLKDSGLQGFATAAHTFTIQGFKTATGGAINAPATTYAKALELRGVTMLKLAPFLAVGPVLNYLIWKQAFPDNVPAFAIKTRDNDESGKTHYIDPLIFTGLRRGWRATGQNALIEYLTHSQDGRQAADVIDMAWRDAKMSVFHLFEGPPVHFAHTLLTGEDTFGRDITRQHTGNPRLVENALAAAKHLNPVLGSFTDPERPRTTTELSERLFRSAGPFGERASATLGSFNGYLNRLSEQRRAFNADRGRVGEQFPQEREYQILQRHNQMIGDLEQRINGQARVAGGLRPVREEMDAGERRELRQRQVELARRALEMARED